MHLQAYSHGQFTCQVQDSDLKSQNILASFKNSTDEKISATITIMYGDRYGSGLGQSLTKPIAPGQVVMFNELDFGKEYHGYVTSIAQVCLEPPTKTSYAYDPKFGDTVDYTYTRYLLNVEITKNKE